MNSNSIRTNQEEEETSLDTNKRKKFVCKQKPLPQNHISAIFWGSNSITLEHQPVNSYLIERDDLYDKNNEPIIKSEKKQIKSKSIDSNFKIQIEEEDEDEEEEEESRFEKLIPLPLKKKKKKKQHKKQHNISKESSSSFQILKSNNNNNNNNKSKLLTVETLKLRELKPDLCIKGFHIHNDDNIKSISPQLQNTIIKYTPLLSTFMYLYDNIQNCLILEKGWIMDGRYNSHLDLSAFHVNDNILINAANNIKTIKTLTLRGKDNNITSKGIGGMVTSLQPSNCLKHLDLSFCEMNSDHINASIMAIALKCGQSLLSLNLRNTFINDIALKAIGTYCKHLNVLNISKCNTLTDEGIGTIISNCKELIDLNISHNKKLHGDFFINIYRLKNHPIMLSVSSIIKINISGCINIKSNFLIELSTSCNHLEEIELNGCNEMKSNDIILLAKNCIKLIRIGLKACSNISNIAIFAIAYYCNDLNSIDISHTNVTDKGIAALLSKCINLEYLYISHLNLTGKFLTINISEITTARSSRFQPDDYSIIDEYNHHEIEFLKELSDDSWENNEQQQQQSINNQRQQSKENQFQLKSLYMSNIKQLKEEYITLLGKRCMYLEELDLSYNTNAIYDENLLSIITNCKYLKLFNIANNHNITDNTISAIACHLNATIHSLDISQYYYDDFEDEKMNIELIYGKFNTDEDIEAYEIGKHQPKYAIKPPKNISIISIECILHILIQCTQLNHLCIRNHSNFNGFLNISSTNLQSLHFPNIHILDLSNISTLTNKGVLNLCNFFPNLIELKISHCPKIMSKTLNSMIKILINTNLKANLIQINNNQFRYFINQSKPIDYTKQINKTDEYIWTDLQLYNKHYLTIEEEHQFNDYGFSLCYDFLQRYNILLLSLRQKKEYKAVCMIQKEYRRYKNALPTIKYMIFINKIKSEHAAIIIQMAYRRYLAYKLLYITRMNRNAAIKIQRMIRSHNWRAAIRILVNNERLRIEREKIALKCRIEYFSALRIQKWYHKILFWRSIEGVKHRKLQQQAIFKTEVKRQTKMWKRIFSNDILPECIEYAKRWRCWKRAQIIPRKPHLEGTGEARHITRRKAIYQANLIVEGKSNTHDAINTQLVKTFIPDIGTGPISICCSCNARRAKLWCFQCRLAYCGVCDEPIHNTVYLPANVIAHPYNVVDRKHHRRVPLIAKQLGYDTADDLVVKLTDANKSIRRYGEILQPIRTILELRKLVIKELIIRCEEIKAKKEAEQRKQYEIEQQELEQAAIKLQSIYRARLAKRNVNEKKDITNEALEKHRQHILYISSLKLQAMTRGMKPRKIWLDYQEDLSNCYDEDKVIKLKENIKLKYLIELEITADRAIQGGEKSLPLLKDEFQILYKSFHKELTQKTIDRVNILQMIQKEISKLKENIIQYKDDKCFYDRYRLELRFKNNMESITSKLVDMLEYHTKLKESHRIRILKAYNKTSKHHIYKCTTALDKWKALNGKFVIRRKRLQAIPSKSRYHKSNNSQLMELMKKEDDPRVKQAEECELNWTINKINNVIPAERRAWKNEYQTILWTEIYRLRAEIQNEKIRQKNIKTYLRLHNSLTSYYSELYTLEFNRLQMKQETYKVATIEDENTNVNDQYLKMLLHETNLTNKINGLREKLNNLRYKIENHTDECEIRREKYIQRNGHVDKGGIFEAIPQPTWKYFHKVAHHVLEREFDNQMWTALLPKGFFGQVEVHIDDLSLPPKELKRLKKEHAIKQRQDAITAAAAATTTVNKEEEVEEEEEEEEQNSEEEKKKEVDTNEDDFLTEDERKEKEKQLASKKRVDDMVKFLNMGTNDTRQLVEAYRIMDNDGSNSIGIDEFFNYINIPRTGFVDLIFKRILDISGDGSLDFSEFIVALGTYSLFDCDEILTICYKLKYNKAIQMMNINDLKELLTLMHNKDWKTNKLFKKIIINYQKSLDDGYIKFSDFVKLDKKYPQILYPAFLIQDKMHEYFLGHSFWLKRMKYQRNKIEIMKEKGYKLDKKKLLSLKQRVEYMKNKELNEGIKLPKI